MAKKSGIVTVNLKLPASVHSTAKSKAALARKSLQDYLSELVASAVK